MAYLEGFATIPRALLFDERMTHTMTRVYLVLSSHVNARQQCWPSMETIASESGVSERTAERTIRSLVELGAISVVPRRGGSRSQTNLYQLGVLPDPAEHADTDDGMGDHDDTGDGIHDDTGDTQNEHQRTITKNPPVSPQEDEQKRKPTLAEFEVTPELREWALREKPGVNVERETEKFRAWHTERRSKYTDWQRAWKNWIKGVRVSAEDKRVANVYRAAAILRGEGQ